jgi:hypothetical protein
MAAMTFGRWAAAGKDKDNTHAPGSAADGDPIDERDVLRGALIPH